MLKLLRASITFQYNGGNKDQGGIAVSDVKVAPRFSLWWDYKNPEQTSLFESYIDLSDDFYSRRSHRSLLTAYQVSELPGFPWATF